jgi:hypothetical protein
MKKRNSNNNLLVTPLLKLCLVTALVLGTFGSADAVTNGRPDGNLHPYVGLVTDFEFACSGILLSPTVFLTAAHCFADGERTYITLDTNGFYAETFSFYAGTFYADPQFCMGCAPGQIGFDTHDVAVVVLDCPVPTSVVNSYGQLPTPNLVDTLPMNTEVTIVGYGVQNFVRGGGQPRPGDIFTRFYAPSWLIQSNNQISDEFIKLTANPAKGKGGMCFGDSGGADFLSDTNIILAVNSFVSNSNCAGVTYSYRIDTPEALGFINQFLNHPINSCPMFVH